MHIEKEKANKLIPRIEENWLSLAQVPAPLNLCILLYNCNAVGSWGSADEWCCVKSQWLNLLMPQLVFSSDHIFRSHHSFSGLVKSQVQQPEVNRSCCCFSTTIQLSQWDTAGAGSCQQLPGSTAQPCIVSVAYIKAGRWKKHCLLCLTKTIRLLRIQILPWNILEAALGELPQHAGRIVLMPAWVCVKQQMEHFTGDE